MGMPLPKKRIIICCDGTFDDFGDTVQRLRPGSHTSRLARWLLPPLVYHILWVFGFFRVVKRIERKILGIPLPLLAFRSNVSHIASAIKPQATDGTQQMVVYVGGIGALGTPQSRFEEAVTGNTMDYKIRYVYRVLVDNYVPGDEVFLVGYSRGAFTVRAVVDFIKCAGLIHKKYMDCFDTVWNAYAERSTDDEKRQDFGPASKILAEIFQRRWGSDKISNFTHLSCTIRCMGVFDTVGSLKAPPLWVNSMNDIEITREAKRRYDGFNIDHNEDVENLFQALALDERRFDFYPAVLSKASKQQNFKQTWFPGVHADMGGRNTTTLGLYPLVWMLSKLQENQLLELDDEYIHQNILDIIRKETIGHKWQPHMIPIRPSHFVDRHPIVRCLIPAWALPWMRHVTRNPRMAAGLKNMSDEDNAKCRPGKSDNHRENLFHWTVRQRLSTPYWEMLPTKTSLWTFLTELINGQSNALQQCAALQRPDPLLPEIEVGSSDILALIDQPTGIDKDLFDLIERQIFRRS